MRKISVLMVLLLALLTVSIAFASGTLTDDAYTVDISGQENTPHDDMGYLSARSSGVGCVVNDEIFLQWDVSNIQAEVSSNTDTSALLIEKIFNSGSGADGALEVWSTSDTWDETTITNENKPLPGDLLASISLPQPDGVLSFSDSALNDFINDQTSWTGGNDTVSGDNIASFIIRVSGCTVSSQLFFSERGGAWGGPPTLELYSPTAVELYAVRASSQPVNQPLIWITLIASIVLIVVALIIYRWRAESH